MSRHGRYGGETKVYVGNLGTGTGMGELERAFGYYGPLRTVWIARNPPGFAFVEFRLSRGKRYSRSRSRGTRSRSFSPRHSHAVSSRRSRSATPRRSRSTSTSGSRGRSRSGSMGRSRSGSPARRVQL